MKTTKPIFEVKLKPFPSYSGRTVELMFNPVEPPFPPGTHLTLTTGESGTIYEDGWGNCSYLHDDGIVYIHFKPDNAVDNDDVESFPLSYFGDFEVTVNLENVEAPKSEFVGIAPSAWISTNTVSGDETLAKNKITSKYENLYEHKALYEMNQDLVEEINDLKRSRDWYKNRVDKLQKIQSQMRDPERTIVCDILANGMLLNDKNRYAVKEETFKPQISVAKMTESNGNETFFVYLTTSENESLMNGFQLFASNQDYEANYFADDLKHYLGLGPEPDILNYGPTENV